MKNFFDSDYYTEFWNPDTNEIWVFGDKLENITEKTPHQYVDRIVGWGDGSEATVELPVTDGHGQREMQKGKVYVGMDFELVGTTAEQQVRRFYNLNYSE